ncbi:hypothetical protein ACHAWF_003357 [Thalassiosira exigua]
MGRDNSDDVVSDLGGDETSVDGGGGCEGEGKGAVSYARCRGSSPDDSGDGDRRCTGPNPTCGRVPDGGERGRRRWTPGPVDPSADGAPHVASAGVRAPVRVDPDLDPLGARGETCAKCTSGTDAQSEAQKARFERDLARRALEMTCAKFDRMERRVRLWNLDGTGMRSALAASRARAEFLAQENRRLGKIRRDAEEVASERARDGIILRAQRKAMEERQLALEETVDLLREELTNATERLVDSEEVRASEARRLRSVSERAKRQKGAMERRQRFTEETVVLLREELGNATERLVDAEEDLDREVGSLGAKLAGIAKERDEAVADSANLTDRCVVLAEDLEASRTKALELESERDRRVEEDRKPADEKARLEEERVRRSCVEDRPADAEANVRRLSAEVVFAHEEISRLAEEREAIAEESEARLREALRRADELEDEARRRDDEFRKLWEKSNASELEVEAAKAKIERLEEGQDEALLAKVKDVQVENDRQEQRIQALKESEKILTEMNDLLKSEKDDVVTKAKKKLETKCAHLRQENSYVAIEMNKMAQEMMLVAEEKDDLMQELSRRVSEEEDLNWKIDALKQSMSLRMKEKDDMLSRMGEQVQEEKESKAKAILKFETALREQRSKLAQKEDVISHLRTEETRYKSEILKMQAKVDRLEAWLHDSLVFSTPPSSSDKKHLSPRSPTKRMASPGSPRKGLTNPQSPSKS